MLIYKFKDDDIIQTLEFVKAYHLEPTKSNRDRTNSGKRSFGAELDSFLIKGLTEIAVCKILDDLQLENPSFKVENICEKIALEI